MSGGFLQPLLAELEEFWFSGCGIIAVSPRSLQLNRACEELVTTSGQFSFVQFFRRKLCLKLVMKLHVLRNNLIYILVLKDRVN